MEASILAEADFSISLVLERAGPCEQNDTPLSRYRGKGSMPDGNPAALGCAEFLFSPANIE